MRGGWDVVRVEAGQVVRSLGRSPGFALAVVGVLGLGVGANAAMFELVDRLFSRPPALLTDPGTVHRVYVDRRVPTGRVEDPVFSHPALATLVAASEEGLSVVGVFDGTFFVSVGDQAPRERPVKVVSGGYFSLFAMRPAAGRLLAPSDDRPGAPPVAVLSHDVWTAELGGDPDVVGRTVSIGRRDYTVVGVTPPAFHGEDLRESVAWVAMAAAGPDVAGPEFDTRPFTTWIEILVRRSGTLAPEVAATRLGRLYLSHREEVAPESVERSDPRVALAPLHRQRGPQRSDAGRIGLWLFGMSVVVLLLACVNVSILMLGRALRRGREAAVRKALGVSRGRLLLRPLLESAVLAVLAVLLALPAAELLVGATARVLLPGDTTVPGLTPRSLGVAVAAVLLAAVLTCLGPALAHLRGAPGEGLRSGGRTGASRGRSRVQRLLVAGQAGLSAVLLLAAGLFARSLDRVAALDLGYDADRVVLVAPTSRTPPGADGPVDREALMRTLREAATSTPGVRAVAYTATVPFWRNSYDPVYREDRTPAGERGRFSTHVVSEGYFEAMGTPILRGRPLRATDDEGAPPVTVVSESMARALWPGEPALGQCLRLGIDTMPCAEVVGVAADIRRGDIRDENGMQFYASWPQYFYGLPRVLAVRTAGDPAAVLGPLRRALQEAAGDEAYVRIERLADRVATQTRTWRLGAAVFGAFGALALALAVFGLFSVVAYDASQRRREFGVRAALGARGVDIVRLVVGTGLAPAAAGLAVGLAAAWLLGSPVEALLFGVPARDPVSFVGAAVLLTASAVAASLMPAWRAARMEPRTVLEAE